MNSRSIRTQLNVSWYLNCMKCSKTINAATFYTLIFSPSTQLFIITLSAGD